MFTNKKQGYNRVPFIGLLACVVVLFLGNAVPASAITFNGFVTDAAGMPIVGATVEMAGNAAVSTTSGTNGGFSLTGLPTGGNFVLEVIGTGYLPVYTNTINYSFDITDPRPKVLFTAQEVGSWGVNPGYGAIVASVTDATNLTNVLGNAIVTASSADHPSTPYPVTYFNGVSFGGSATFLNGLAFALNLDNGDTVTLHTTKSGWNFPDCVFSIPGDAVGEALLLGTPAPVPEPSTLLLLGAGIAGVGFLIRRKRC